MLYLGRLREAAVAQQFRIFIEGSLKGSRPFKTYTSPSPLKERGTKGVRLINNLIK